MNKFKYTVSFRIEHPNMDPRKISAALSLEPKSSWKEGEPRETHTGQPLDGTRKTSYLSHRLASQPDIGLAKCLYDFTLALERNKGFLRKVRATGGRSEYFIGWFSGRQSGEVLPYNLLEKL